ncbi:cytochrome P450 [Methylocucumis oryzae]|uniref:cytochrome P450 n=1 Tax=Methylocucumis oryzae TaxID=1632867 RepID=UPI000697AFD4|nr:cytochrome P450 [Methylocucumis oryzae]
MRKALAPLLGDGLFISDGEIWQKHRSLETPMFSTEQVAKYSEIMCQTTDERVATWSRYQPGQKILVLPEMGQLTAEIICRSLFGNQLGTEQAASVIQSFADYQAAIEQMDINTFFWLAELDTGFRQ